MSQDVLSAIGSKSDELLDQAMQNIELCQRFMAFVSLCALEAHRRGTGFDGIRVGNVEMTENRMRAHVSFTRLIVPRPMPSVPEASTFKEFLAKEAYGLWLMILKNPDFMTYLGQVCSKMRAYCSHKGLKFSELKFSDGFMDREDNIVLAIEEAEA
jgi:hypothetical protein